MFGVYDVVVPVYGEHLEALRSTVEACLAQSLGPATVWVVDDGSPEPLCRSALPPDERVRLLRLEENSGISAARMKAIALSQTPFVACVNVDVLPHPDWAEILARYASERSELGAVYGRLVPANPNPILTRWRMRFHEQKYDGPSGPAPFAPGHAVLFRRAALDAVGGYDVRLRRIAEDSDICERMRAAGYETHYVRDSAATSIQPDHLDYLARKQLLRDGFDPSRPLALSGLPRYALGRALNRIARNTYKLRFSFLPVDVAVFALELIHYLRSRRASTKRVAGSDKMSTANARLGAEIGRTKESG